MGQFDTNPFSTAGLSRGMISSRSIFRWTWRHSRTFVSEECSTGTAVDIRKAPICCGSSSLGVLEQGQVGTISRESRPSAAVTLGYSLGSAARIPRGCHELRLTLFGPGDARFASATRAGYSPTEHESHRHRIGRLELQAHAVALS